MKNPKVVFILNQEDLVVMKSILYGRNTFSEIIKSFNENEVQLIIKNMVNKELLEIKIIDGKERYILTEKGYHIFKIFGDQDEK